MPSNLATAGFKVSREKASWDDAFAKCAKNRGRLAVVPDNDTWKFIKDRLGIDDYWLGATDVEKEGEWKWINGTSLDFGAWKGGEPNNMHVMRTTFTSEPRIDGATLDPYLILSTALSVLRLYLENLEDSNPEIAEIFQQMRQELAAVASAYQAQIGTIHRGYTGALKRELEKSIASGELDAALLLKKKQQRLENGFGPGEEDAKRPPALSKLRQTCHQAVLKYEKERYTKASPILRRANARLEISQDHLRAEKLDHQAVELRAYRKALTAFAD